MNKQQVLSFIPDFKEIQESPLILEGKEVAYQASVVLKDNYPLGTGFSLDPAEAKLIALSEAIERKTVLQLISSSQKSEFLLDEYPTSCGFAVGTDRESSLQRAVAEAVERWLRSKWIDEGFAQSEFQLDVSNLNPIEKYFASFFSNVRFFAHSCSILFQGKTETVNSVTVVGLTEKGAFVGSKSKVGKKAPLLSALVEAWRHLKLSMQTQDNMPELKIINFFAENKDLALMQIERAKKTPFPSPKVRLVKEVPVPIDGVCCYRVLCEDYLGWHGPNITRFVY